MLSTENTLLSLPPLPTPQATQAREDRSLLGKTNQATNLRSQAACWDCTEAKIQLVSHAVTFLTPHQASSSRAEGLLLWSSFSSITMGRTVFFADLLKVPFSQNIAVVI